MTRIHFISGLPRSGSTLLSAILRQNPLLHAGIQTPAADLVAAVIRTAGASEGASAIAPERRLAIADAVLSAFYSHLTGRRIVFDTGRAWPAMLPLLARIRPDARIICLVRKPSWILDSMERLYQQSGIAVTKVFNQDYPGTVFSRAELLARSFVGVPMSALKQAWYSEHAKRLIVVRHESLVARPARVVEALYEQLGIPRFEHDFERVDYEEAEFDVQIGLPGLHCVSGRVEPRPRDTILPPELFQRHEQEFWSGIGSNPRNVCLL